MDKNIATEQENLDNTRVIGIGTSAGGLEALQDFFKNVPLNSDLAFVVIQHLSPDYKSLMDELLARYTTLPIFVIKSGMVIKTNTIYLIPPRKNLYIVGNKLILREVDANKGLNLPIDTFFRSLAEEKGKDAIGIVLSGTGTDGTAGIKAIKEKNGMVMAQDERSAKFSGMPNSAIATGLVDFILHPNEMAEQIIRFIQHPLIKSNKQKSEVITDDAELLLKAIVILKEKFGIDFFSYKENTLLRRLERRVSINHFMNLTAYVNYLEESDNEKEILFRELLIGVTQFFRDKEAFISLNEKVLTKLVNSNSKTIRIWSAGCSTGEEVYSIAISLRELCINLNIQKEIKIFATDIDKRALEIAGNGIYPESILLDIEPHLVARYFVKKDNFYKVNDEIRNLIVFASHNILKDPPFSKIDLLICRNLFIYLKPEVQNRLLVMFYYSLQPGGFLFMGISESIGELTKAFKAIDTKNKIFEYMAGFKPPILAGYSLGETKYNYQDTGLLLKRKSKFEINNEELFEVLLNQFAPPTIIIDSDNHIVTIINDINPFAEIQKGNYNGELFSILPKDVALFINNMLRELKKNKKNLVQRNLTGLKSNNKDGILVTGRKIEYHGNNYFALSFQFIRSNEKTEEVVLPEYDLSLEKDQRIFELEKELKSSRENLNAVIEELESSNEELQSSNEELVASNEELQSVNEELQSVNEELYTVNTELQQKIDELTRLNDDINNLLKNTQVAALYLDSRLLIRKTTPELSKITNIIESDIGRPISHITLIEGYDDFLKDIEVVRETLKPVDREVKIKNKETFLLRLRPYRTEYGAIDGVIITFTDVSAIKKLEGEILNYSDKLKEVLLVGKVSWLEYCYNKDEIKFDKSISNILDYNLNELPKKMDDLRLITSQADFKKIKIEINKFVNDKSYKTELDIRLKRKDDKHINAHLKGKVFGNCISEEADKLLITISDTTELVKVTDSLKLNKEILNIAVENSLSAITVVDENGKLVFANKAAEKIFGINVRRINERVYDDLDWKILDLEKKPIQPEKLPYSIVKNTKKVLNNYRHYILNPKKGYVLLNIDGTPILSKEKFIGAIFVVNEVTENE